MTKHGTIRSPDVNRAIHLLALKELGRLLEEAANQHFTGQVSVTIDAKNGRLGQPRVMSNRFADVEL